LTTKSKHSVHDLRKDADEDASWQGLWARDDIFYGTVGGVKGLEQPTVVIAKVSRSTPTKRMSCTPPLAEPSSMRFYWVT